MGSNPPRSPSSGGTLHVGVDPTPTRPPPFAAAAVEVARAATAPPAGPARQSLQSAQSASPLIRAQSAAAVAKTEFACIYVSALAMLFISEVLLLIIPAFIIWGGMGAYLMSLLWVRWITIRERQCLTASQALAFAPLMVLTIGLHAWFRSTQSLLWF
eukprot:gene47188-51607_t